MEAFNRIIKSGEFPSCWSMGLIVLIHKSGDKCLPDNYRAGVYLFCVASIKSLQLQLVGIKNCGANLKMFGRRNNLASGKDIVQQMLYLFCQHSLKPHTDHLYSVL